MKEDLNKFIEIYEDNKSIIKDNSFKTIEKFMNLFKNPNLSKLTSDNDLDFFFKIKLFLNSKKMIIIY